MDKIRHKRYPVQLDKKTFFRLEALSRMNHRTLGGQVAWMIERFVTELPHPEDAKPVPVLYIDQEVQDEPAT
jgi:hypothetical protein